MTTRMLSIMVLMLALVTTSTAQQPTDREEDRGQVSRSNYLTTQADSLGYVIGYRFGSALTEQEAQLNRTIVMAGVRDALDGGQTTLDLGAVFGVLQSAKDREARLIESGDTTEYYERKLFGRISKNDASSISTWNDSISYALGYQYADEMKKSGIVVTTTRVLDGMRDEDAGMESAVGLEGELALNLAIQNERQMKQLEQIRIVEREVEQLIALSESPGYESTESGIVYEILTEGDGPSPSGEQTLILHVVSFFMNEDQPFLDTRTTNQPIEVYLPNADPNWIPVLEMMKVGSVYRMYLPPKIGFARAPEDVPRRVIVYEMELVELVDPVSADSEI